MARRRRAILPTNCFCLVLVSWCASPFVSDLWLSDRNSGLSSLPVPSQSVPSTSSPLLKPRLETAGSELSLSKLRRPIALESQSVAPTSRYFSSDLGGCRRDQRTSYRHIFWRMVSQFSLTPPDLLAGENLLAFSTAGSLTVEGGLRCAPVWRPLTFFSVTRELKPSKAHRRLPFQSSDPVQAWSPSHWTPLMTATPWLVKTATGPLKTLSVPKNPCDGPFQQALGPPCNVWRPNLLHILAQRSVRGREIQPVLFR